MLLLFDNDFKKICISCTSVRQLARVTDIILIAVTNLQNTTVQIVGHVIFQLF